MPALMIQGCGSDVGKSVLVAGLCRWLSNCGYRVRPFKPQNMSNNAAVTSDGGEIGRSTALQALACRTPATVEMNPILLKPESDTGAQLIVRGKRVGVLDAMAHGRDKRALLDIALDCYTRLASESDWVVIEGAGSPAETNLRTHDIANMGFAEAAALPVVLVGDIDRGHVIASLVGAHAVLDAADRERIHGFIINKFRGNAALFTEGLTTIVERTQWQSLGVVPWLAAARWLPAEDAVVLERGNEKASHARIKIAVPLLPHIANFDDFDPLRHEPDVEFRFVVAGEPLPLDASLIVLPGSKATVTDLEFLRTQGWDHDLHAYVRRGGRVLGICAGYQMLGSTLHDPERIESAHGSVAGLGLLEVSTTLTAEKILREVRGIELRTGAGISGYEMHLGRTTGSTMTEPMLRFDDGTNDGAITKDGRVAGCHVHGLFSSRAYRSALLASLGGESGRHDHAARIDASLDAIAAGIAATLDTDALLDIGHRPGVF